MYRNILKEPPLSASLLITTCSNFWGLEPQQLLFKQNQIQKSPQSYWLLQKPGCQPKHFTPCKKNRKLKVGFYQVHLPQSTLSSQGTGLLYKAKGKLKWSYKQNKCAPMKACRGGQLVLLTEREKNVEILSWVLLYSSLLKAMLRVYLDLLCMTLWGRKKATQSICLTSFTSVYKPYFCFSWIHRLCTYWHASHQRQH